MTAYWMVQLLRIINKSKGHILKDNDVKEHVENRNALGAKKQRNCRESGRSRAETLKREIVDMGGGYTRKKTTWGDWAGPMAPID